MKTKEKLEKALIQTALFQGWGCFVKNQTIDTMTDSEKKYLYNSALSYFVADKWFQNKTLEFYKAL